MGSRRFHELVGVHGEQLGAEEGTDSNMINLGAWTKIGVATTSLVTSELPDGYSSAIQIDITGGAGGVTMEPGIIPVLGQRYKHSMLYKSSNSGWRIRAYEGKLSGGFGISNVINADGQWNWLHTYGIGVGAGGLEESLYLDKASSTASIQVAHWNIKKVSVEQISEILDISAQSGTIISKYD